MASKLVLRKADYDLIAAKLTQAGFLGKSEQDFQVTTQRDKGVWYRTIHIFSRPPMPSELNEYEDKASKIKFKGTKAQIEGSKINAAKDLYNKIILAVFDLPLGRIVYGSFEVPDPNDRAKTIVGKPLDREEALERVPVLTKRAAILDMVGEVYSAAQLEEREGEDEELGSKSEDD